MRALECSGPWPSNPWGSSSDRLLRCPHLSAAATMNWSMITCATLAKSPNCASQHTSASDRDRVPVLEAERGVLREHGVVDHERRLIVGQVGERHVLGSLSWSTSTLWRWLNVPRRVSWPGEAHRGALEHERAERERLGERPVDLVAVELGAAGEELALELAVGCEALGTTW